MDGVVDLGRVGHHLEEPVARRHLDLGRPGGIPYLGSAGQQVAGLDGACQGAGLDLGQSGSGVPESDSDTIDITVNEGLTYIISAGALAGGEDDGAA